MLKRLSLFFFLFSSSVALAQSADNPAASYAEFTSTFTKILNFISAKVSAYVNFNLSLHVKFIFSIVLLSIVYYLFVWLLYGKDPKKGNISTLSTPPDNLTPAAMHFITSMRMCDEKTLSATFMSMVIKKFIKISDNNGEMNLEKIGTDTASLSDEEKIVNDTLFNQTTNFLITRRNVDALYQANKKIDDYLTLTYPDIGRTNYYLTIPGLILLAIAYIAGVLGSPPTIIPTLFRLVLNIPLLIFIFLTLNFFYMMFISLFNYIITFDSKYLSRIFLGLFVGVFIGSMSGFFLLSPLGLPFMTTVLLLALLTVNCVSLIYLPQPSKESMEIRNKIEGFKSYLQTREKYNASEASQLTETAYKYLPYAIALDVDNRWGNQLNAALENIRLPVVTKMNTMDMEYKKNQGV